MTDYIHDCGLRQRDTSPRQHYPRTSWWTVADGGPDWQAAAQQAQRLQRLRTGGVKVPDRKGQ